MSDSTPSTHPALPVLTEMRGAVMWITINREERRNALNEEVVLMIDRSIEAAGNNPDCRAIVLTGVGDKAFCAGADLQKGVQGGAFDVDYSQPRHYLVDLFNRMRACRIPIIARVNGHVMAGGIGVLCSCDMAIAADDALFGTPETKIGMVPMMILPSMLRIIPERKLLEMCITGEPYNATQALELGMLNYSVPRAELDGKVDWLLSRILDKSPTAIRIGKQAFHAMRDMSMESALQYAQVTVPVMASTQDAKEGIASFQEKRKPKWTGK
ncbi:enoyl-CoA hydratase/isomerase family protein [Orrella sp. NBD-18]|uniref:Enoyl-CoA hydratase/isomerase family protein n=1 Tax=Sheuella amnicola TaxID=2707330 RepID=A0A6B2QTM1_9BURK|nr:enoyl-CoA hydratase-related protein [Sheuella amnicola]NDY82066.1 enoyl-CoA hydratase/isomerase family protein [Sheuella amnicola]